MYKKNDKFIKWASDYAPKDLAKKLNKKGDRSIYYYLHGERCPSKETMKLIDKLSKGQVPIQSWF